MKKRYISLCCSLLIFIGGVFSFNAWGQPAVKIRAGDTFDIRVEGEPHLNTTGVVSQRGYISYRRLGEVYVTGIIPEAAAVKIAILIKRYYPFLNNPRVTVLINNNQLRESVQAKEYKGVEIVTFSEQKDFYDGQLETVYRISPHDTLEISVFGEPDLTKTLRVSEDGLIRYPLIGRVSVEGLTEEELTRKLEDLLKDNYFVNPKVGVFIVEYAKFSILGKVKRPGAFELKGRINLVEAFVLAEGPLEKADLSKIKIFRSQGEEKGKERQYIVDLEKEGKAFYLKPADRIVVEAKGKIYILGAVNNPGIYHLKEEKISLADALTFLAGGTANNAKLSDIEIIRKNEEGKNITYTVDLEQQGNNFLLQEQDRVIVKAYGNISVFGQVASPGRYPYTKGLTAVDALALAGGFTTVAARNGVRVIRKKDGEKKTIKVPVGYILATGDASRDVELEDGDTVVVPESWF